MIQTAPQAPEAVAPQAAPAYTPDLAKLRRYFEEARDLTAEARRQSLKDKQYYDGKQLSADELNTLKRRKQPALVINRIRPAVNGILGVIEKGKSDPRGYPRNPADEDAADVATDTLRYICDLSRWHRKKISGARTMMVEGTAAVIVEMDGEEVSPRTIRWEEFFYDPRAREEDFSDARYMGIAKWMYADDARALPGGEKLGEMGADIAADDTFLDRPEKFAGWVDQRARRVLVIEMYHREGERWYRCVFCASGLLEAAESPYQDEKGKACCPIVAVSAYVDEENNRYGVVRDMRDPQDEINKRRSKLLHLVNSRQVQAQSYAEGAGIAMAANADDVRKEAAKPDGVLPPGWTVVPTNDMASGQANLLAEAKAEIERMGPNPAVLGRQGEDSSGRALLTRQQAGMVELAVTFGLLEDWETRVLKQMWARARQFWTAPKWIRVTDDEGTPRFVQLNAPQMAQVPVETPFGVHVVQQQTGVDNEVAQMDVDIIVESVPDTANLQQEQFTELLQLAQAYGPQAVPFEMAIEMSSMPKKRQLLEKIEKLKAEAAQGAGPQQQLQVQAAVASIRKDMTQADLNEAKAQATMTGAAVDVHTAMNPPQPAAGASGEPGFPAP
jgi:hypothetical protein